MEKRVILATIISTIIIVLWWLFFTPKQQPVPNINVNKPVPIQKNNLNEIKSVTVISQQQKKDVDSKIEKYTFESDNWKIVLNSLGAKIEDYYIKEKIQNRINQTNLILDPTSNNFATFPENNFKLISSETQNDFLILTFVTKLDNWTKFYKIYKLNKNDFFHKLIFKLESDTKRNTDNRYELNIYFGPGLGSSESTREEDNRLTRVTIYEKLFKGYRLRTLKQGEYPTTGSRWISIDNRYFTLCIIGTEQLNNLSVLRNKDKLYNIKINKQITLSEKDTSFELPFYFGIKQYKKLKNYGYDLEKIIDFGLFAPLSKLFLSSLIFFNSIFKNYGVAIILLTIIIQILTVPLTMKSLQATKAMKQLQPKLKELQQKYKSDPKRLNTEMMYLYKSQKVNPMGGCLPMLLQLPIFWALFVTLRNSYELRGANFILWITDLSSPDQYRILPILMGLSMFVQQKISGTGAVDQSQKMMLYLMPVIFTIIFINFPSGLVLYWLVNNILTIGIQFILLKRVSGEEVQK